MKVVKVKCDYCKETVNIHNAGYTALKIKCNKCADKERSKEK